MKMILSILEGRRQALFFFTKSTARLNTRSEGTYDGGMARYVLAKPYLEIYGTFLINIHHI